MHEPAAAPTLDAVARTLRRAAETGVPCAPVRDSLAGPDGIARAYEVQAINVAARLAAGGRVVGRKIGLTSLAVQAQLGVDQPDFGTLLDDMVFADGEEVPASRLLQPRAEAEVALVLARDLTAERPHLAELISSVAYALAAIEVVDSRIADWSIDILDTVADNASAGAVVLGGSPRLLTGLDLAAVEMTMSRDGEVVSSGVGANCLGHPLTAALWLARRLAALGEPLAEGDVILTGALGPMAQAGPGQRFTADLAGLGQVSFGIGADAHD